MLRLSGECLHRPHGRDSKEEAACRRGSSSLGEELDPPRPAQSWPEARAPPPWGRAGARAGVRSVLPPTEPRGTRRGSFQVHQQLPTWLGRAEPQEWTFPNHLPQSPLLRLALPRRTSWRGPSFAPPKTGWVGWEPSFTAYRPLGLCLTHWSLT